MGTLNHDETSELYPIDGMSEAQKADFLKHHLDAARAQIRKLQSRVDELTNKCNSSELIIDDLKMRIAEYKPIIEGIQLVQRIFGIFVAVFLFALTVYQAMPK